METPRLVRTIYAVRTGGFAYCFLALGLLLWERGASAEAWVLCAAQFLVYPHLLYLRARHSKRPRQAEFHNLFVDSTLFGAWCAYFGFEPVVTLGLVAATVLNATVNRGIGGGLLSVGFSLIGALAFVVVAGLFNYAPAASDLVNGVLMVGILAYTCAVGYVVYRQNRRLVCTRDKLQASEERYRLIAENVADLIGMVDHDGRWLYASPSYERVLERADLEPGVDAFLRVHPDDAERARMAVGRVAATGRSREVVLHLVDREGRMRQYKTLIHAFAGDEGAVGAPRHRLILASRDVTDLRSSEERLILHAHALEGMTEAIMITLADGTIQTVNRAFCEITGHDRDDVVGQSETAFRNALQPESRYAEIYAEVEREGYWSGTLWSRRKNGAVYREWRSIRAIRDLADVTTHYVIVFYEVGSPRHYVANLGGRP
ncbi:MAG TPA: PAS domain S-box protein [Burkholderiales bacterium]|jgi:PAS domain S-box-containing protein|nr:PAS domain S-box protein [Burkholderiales bacterium]